MQGSAGVWVRGGDRQRRRACGLVLAGALGLLACSGQPDSPYASEGSRTSASLEDPNPSSEAGSDPEPTTVELPPLSETECTALVDFMERGAPSPIDGSVPVDVAALPEGARPAAEVLVASYEEVFARLRREGLPVVDADVSAIAEVADLMEAPEVVAAVEQLQGMAEGC